MLKAKPSKLFIFLGICGGYVWLALATLHPPLPCDKKPLIFYSNQTRDDLKQVVISALQKAKSSIFLQIYGLTDPDIITLLLKKKSEGIKVFVAYDRSASKSLPKALEALAIKTKGLMHRKILIIDESLCFMGTANFTPQSLKMHGNVMVGLYSPSLAAALADSQHFKDETVESYLLPQAKREALKRVCTAIDSAQSSIQLALFTLTHSQMIDALIKAKDRGVNITLCVDRYTAQGASAKALAALEQAGIKVLHSQGDQLLHHKLALIDKKTLILGSANWTVAAFEKNHDGLWVFDDLQPTENKKLQKLWKTIENGCQLR